MAPKKTVLGGMLKYLTSSRPCNSSVLPRVGEASSSANPKGKEQGHEEDGEEDVTMLHPTAATAHVEAKKRKQDCEIRHKFQ